jgi:UDP-N-acetylmuramate-alanine ligase
MREDLAKRAMNVINENGLNSRVTIINGDMFKVDLSSADVIYLYLTTSANEKSKQKWRLNSKVASCRKPRHEVVGWKPAKIEPLSKISNLVTPATQSIYTKNLKLVGSLRSKIAATVPS